MQKNIDDKPVPLPKNFLTETLLFSSNSFDISTNANAYSKCEFEFGKKSSKRFD